MLWRTIRAYFLPSAHPGLRPVREGGGEEFRPKVDEWGKRVEAEDWGSVWDGYRADRIRARNRALVRPHMGRYIRRWAGLAAALWLLGEGLAAAGLTVLGWTALAGAGGGLVMVVMLVLLRQEMQG